MKRRIRALAAGLCIALTLTLPALSADFADVAEDAWYAQAVEAVTATGIMNGVSDTAFGPEERVTRGTVVTVLWRMAGQPEAEDPGPFPDVESWFFYADAVAWAREAGIAAGRGDGTFGGGETVTREQLAVFLYRYAQHSGHELAEGVLENYPDSGAIHDWAREGMAHALGAGLITGGQRGTLEPEGPATRAQLAVILQRLMTPAVG